jgi:tetratricopeptide (TPR) repeat protein
MKQMLTGITIIALLLLGCTSRLVINRSITSVSYGSRAYAHFAKGEIGSAVAMYRKAASEATVNDLPIYHAKYIMNIGRCFYEIDSIDTAMGYFDKAVSEFAFYNDTKSVSICNGLRVLCFVRKQQHDSASVYCNANITLDDPYLRHYWLSVAAQERIAQNDIKTAEEYLDLCIRYYTKKKHYDALSNTHMQKAIVYTRGNRNKEAIDASQHALDALEKTDFQLNRWKILAGISGAYRELGDSAAARIFCERSGTCAPEFVAEVGCEGAIMLFSPPKSPAGGL